MSQLDRIRNKNAIVLFFAATEIPPQHQGAMVEMFLEDFGFDPGNCREGRLKNHKAAFINLHWKEFCRYVQLNYVYYLELQYT